ncbi:MAG: hypothetical protein U0235_03090 [Polyangiaceae bacterium]
MATGESDGERPRGIVYTVRSQSQLDWMSLVRIPLALVVLLGSLVLLMWGAIAAMRALAIESNFALKVVTVVAFGVALFAATRAAKMVRSRGPATQVVVHAGEVRYVRPNGEAEQFPNHGITLAPGAGLKLVVRAGGAEHLLPRTVELEGDDGPGFYRLDVQDGKVVVARTSIDGESTEALPFDVA